MSTVTTHHGQTLVSQARARWSQWAASCGDQFADRQWLLSKYEVSATAAWTPEKTDLLLTMLWEKLHLVPGQHLVELCCGGGWLVGGLADRAVRGTGIDFAPDMVRVARRRWPDVQWVAADATACPLPTGCADAVLCYFALINIESPVVQAGILAEVRRLLRPGGRALVGHLPLRGMSEVYDLAKARYASTFGGSDESDVLRETCRPPIVLFTKDELLGWGSTFSHAWLEPSFNHLWFSGEPFTCPWRVDLCLIR